MMDQSGHYTTHPRHAHFQPPQLPSPSQLQLPVPSSYSRSITLPPIASIPSGRFSQYSGPGLQSSPTLQSPTSAQPSWHRTSNSREEIHPSRHLSRQNSSGRSERGVKRELASLGGSSSTNGHHDPSSQPPLTPLLAKENGAVGAEDGMPSTSDFVKKLYKMLEDQSFQHVVSWGLQGDCFVVKDMNEFTKSILPRMFKHSNFASFVRQLNKYDFHKVKNTDDSQFGEHSWTFRHPDFHADRRDALENIKRKVPTQRKPSAGSHARPVSSTSPAPNPASPAVEALQLQVEQLTQSHEEMTAHVRRLERNYQDVLVEMVNFQRNMAQQDGLMQNLIQYFLQVENGKVRELGNTSDPSAPPSDQNPFLPTDAAQRMMGSYPESDVARASLVQMNEISRRAEVAGMSFNEPIASSSTHTNGGIPSRKETSRILAAAAAGLMGENVNGGDNGEKLTRQAALARIEELQRSRPASAQGNMYLDDNETFVMDGERVEPGHGTSLQRWNNGADGSGVGAAGSSHQGLQVYTMGHLMPKSNIEDGNWAFDESSLSAMMPMPMDGIQGEAPVSVDSGEGDTSGYGVPSSAADGSPDADFCEAGSNSAGPTRPNSPQKLRVRRSTFVPGWAVPPRVLLVDDDAVSRKLSSKFLQVFGCTIDVAVDGIGAVNKMNLAKYDLVLMDIVMPKLDGVSATSLIRQFDHMTPIISMTSNSKPNEIMTYYSSGMNDILPKPFTKEGLLDMLEKHLMHLKVIQQMSKVPRSVGIPPLNDSSFEQALTTPAASTIVQMNPTAGGDDDGRINPLAGMGLTDEQYAMILHNLVNGESFPGAAEKRTLEETDDGRDGKRGRFEVVE